MAGTEAMITYIIASNYKEYAEYCKENKIDPNDPVFVRDTRDLIKIDPNNSKFIFTKLASKHTLYEALVKQVDGILTKRRRGHDVHEEVLASNSRTSD